MRHGQKKKNRSSDVPSCGENYKESELSDCLFYCFVHITTRGILMDPASPEIRRAHGLKLENTEADSETSDGMVFHQQTFVMFAWTPFFFFLNWKILWTSGLAEAVITTASVPICPCGTSRLLLPLQLALRDADGRSLNGSLIFFRSLYMYI